MSSLYIDRRGVELELESGAIIFRENGERIGTIPIAPLKRIFMRGDVRFSASLLGKLGESGIGVVFLTGRQGKPSFFIPASHNDATRRVAQIRASLDADCCLTLARKLVAAKIAAQKNWFDELRQNNLVARYELTHALQLLSGHEAKLPGIDSLAKLRGLEGSAASCYFSGLKAVIPESLGFKARNRRPPRDPFNALLSLSYTMLLGELVLALHGAGYDPYVGFYHQLEFGRESLACDLLEPMRPQADRFAFSLIRRGIINKEHFTTNQAGCLLGKAGRTHFYTAWENEKESMRNAACHQVDDFVLDLPQIDSEV
jgi:CRISPR-associated protein Cas1